MSDASSASITGVWWPVVTPFTPDGEPSPAHLLAHCRWLVQQGCSLALFGTNSKGNSLSVAEKCDLLPQLVVGWTPDNCHSVAA